MDFLSVGYELSWGLWGVSVCPGAVSSGKVVPIQNGSLTLLDWLHVSDEVSHSIPLHGFLLQESLVHLSNPTCFSCIFSLLFLAGILRWLPWDMLLFSTAFLYLLDLASFLLCLFVWALVVVWPLYCMLGFLFFCYVFLDNNRTDALKTDINLFFTITNCLMARSRLLTHHMNFKFICLSAYWQ